MFSKSSPSATNLSALDNMMPRSGSRGSTPPTPGNELEDGQNNLDDYNRKTLTNMVTTPPVAKEKKKLIFKKVKLLLYVQLKLSITTPLLGESL